MADEIERTVPGERRRQARLAASIVAVIAVAAGVVYTLVLCSPERGSGMAALTSVCLAMWVGLPLTLYGLQALPGLLPGGRGVPVGHAVALAFGLAVGGLPAISSLGGQWYLVDQADAKAFVDRRIAIARASGPAWPTSQAAFVGGEALPRMLRGKSFYSATSDGLDFEVAIPVDFDGGWFLRSDQPEWRRTS